MRVALVTGGSRGIGREICINLSKNGHYILINYVSNDIEANKTLELIKEVGGDGELLKFDVGNSEACFNALSNWKNNNIDKYIEVLVNNAGIRKDNLLMWMEPNEWDSVISTGLDSFYNVTQPLLKDMLVKRKGQIVNIVSLSGIKGLPGQTNYSAAKGGVIAATKALAQEVAKKGVRVNAVAPGFIATEMTEGLNETELKKLIPMGRFGKAQEVANLVKFLVSDEASYITGECISINGGLYT